MHGRSFPPFVKQLSPMNKEKVISREYKIMLKADKFQGETAQVLAIYIYHLDS